MPPNDGLRRLRVDLDDVLAAFSRGSNTPRIPHLDLHTGQVVPVPDARHPAVDPEDMEDDEVRTVLNQPRRYREIPRIAPHEEQDLMAEFAHAQDDGGTRFRLVSALRSTRPMAAFSQEVAQDAALSTRWTWWRKQAHLDEAVAWLHMVGVDPVHPLLTHAVPSAPAAAPHPVPPLLDVLFLSPRTDVGRDRCITFTAADEAHAQRALEQWSGLMVQLDGGRKVRLIRVGTRVELRVAVDPASG